MIEETPESQSKQQKQQALMDSIPGFKETMEEAEKDIYDDPIPDNRDAKFKKLVGEIISSPNNFNGDEK